MQITFLGTGSAEGYPNAFCRCANCQRARALGGPSLRARSAALIDDDLLIDLGPDVPAAAIRHGRSLATVRHCLITHAHSDHLDPTPLLARGPEWGIVGAPHLDLYASAASLRRLAALLEGELGPAGPHDPAHAGRLNLTLHAVAPLQLFQAGRYQVLALPATHDPATEPLLYAIAADGRCILYATDTAALPEATWRACHEGGLRFDLAILDHSYGPDEAGDDHLGAREVISHAARLRAEGLMAAGGRVIATHISPAGNPVHPELVAYAARHGYEVAYDGLTV